jgi:uncharacterized membrane protein
MQRMKLKYAGAALGLLFGWLIVQYGFFRALFVLVLAVIGWMIGRILDGEVDISEYLALRDRENLE